MEEKLNNLAKEVFLIQQDRMLIINKDNARFAKLEEAIKKLEKAIEELELANGAQITLNQHFFKQLGVLEIRLKNEETKPLVTIPSLVPSAWNVPATSSPVNKMMVVV